MQSCVCTSTGALENGRTFGAVVSKDCFAFVLSNLQAHVELNFLCPCLFESHLCFDFDDGSSDLTAEYPITSTGNY